MLARLWMLLPAISLVTLAQQDSRALGPWKLGMTRDEVKAVKDNGPYKPVRLTGGIETANGIFDGERRNVAFVFGENGTVNKIQFGRTKVRLKKKRSRIGIACISTTQSFMEPSKVPRSDSRPPSTSRNS
ncbi:MAG: hypothetical protein ABI822_12250 [Bryobacteraceae bacterium]